MKLPEDPTIELEVHSIISLVNGDILESDKYTLTVEQLNAAYDSILNTTWSNYGFLIAGDFMVVLRERINFIRLIWNVA